MKIFISSVQKEFAAERKALAEYLSGDPLLRRFFETFLFERDVPVSDLRPDAVYLDEVRKCDLYLGLFGDEYGRENDDGVSPTHLEYTEATGSRKGARSAGTVEKGRGPVMKLLVPAGQVEAHGTKAAPPTTPTAANSGEFAIIKKQAWLNSFTFTPKQWIEKTAAIGKMQTLTARTAKQLEGGSE